MKGTQTQTDSDQPNEELVSEWQAASHALMWFEYQESDKDQTTVICEFSHRFVPNNRLQ